jgi:MFS family permease
MDTSPAQNAPQRRTPFAALLGANAISLVGNQLTLVAVPWFVLQTSGSPVRAGQVGALGALAAAGAALLGGGLIDRVGARRASVATDLASGVAVALIPLLHHTVGLAFWQLAALVFLRALLNTPGGAARQSLLPELIAVAHLRPERGNAAYQGVQNFAQLAGPALAGALVPRPATRSPGTVMPMPTSLTTALREGFQFIARDRLVATLTVTAMVTNGLGTAFFGVILPVYARNRFGRVVDLGLILAGWGGGAIIGAVAYGTVGLRLPRRPYLLLGTTLVGAPLWIFAALPTLPLISTIAALGVMGLCGGAVNPLAFTLLQERIPAPLRGRVFGTFFALGGSPPRPRSSARAISLSAVASP